MKINKGSPLKIIFLTIIVLAGIYFFQQSTKEGMKLGGTGTLPPKKMKMGGIGTLPPKKMKSINKPSSNQMRYSRM
jgi:hypothetical protein